MISMRYQFQVFIIIFLVALAGCSSNPDLDTQTESELTTIEPLTDSTTETTIETTTQPMTEAHPFSEQVISVGVDPPESGPSNVYQSAKKGVQWWQNNSDIIDFNAEFEYTPNSSSADIVLDYTPTIERCGEEISRDTFLYCAPQIERSTSVDEKVHVNITSRYTPDHTTTVTKLAIGHNLGIDSSSMPVSEPQDYQLRNPWFGKSPVVVNVSYEVNTSRNISPLVAETLEYWENQPQTVKNYTADFELRPDADHADVTVEYEDEIFGCGMELDFGYIGCADQLDQDTTAPTVTEVSIEDGYTDKSTVSTLKHEFGHVYGRLHGQEPMPLMNKSYDATRLPLENATTSDRPFTDPTATLVLVTENLSVYVDYDSFSASQSKVKDQVDHALNYYSTGGGAEYMEYSKFYYVTNKSEADIRIVSEELSSAASRYYVVGYDLDEDDAMEYYESVEIKIDPDTDRDHIGWHVGSWIGMSATDVDQIEDLPPPFDDEHDDREYWW